MDLLFKVMLHDALLDDASLTAQYGPCHPDLNRRWTILLLRCIEQCRPAPSFSGGQHEHYAVVSTGIQQRSVVSFDAACT